MGRFPDFSRLVARGLLTVTLAFLGAGVMWLARACGDALTPAAPESGARMVALPQMLSGGGDGGAVSVDDLCAVGQQFWEEYVPAEIRAQYEFPSIDELRRFLARLEGELEGGSLERLAGYERDARRALKLLRRREGGDLLAAWLEPRLDMLKAAAQITATPMAPWPEVLAGPAAPAVPVATVSSPLLPGPDVVRPHYTQAYWDRVLARRRTPQRTAELIPRLKEIFAAAGVPPELVWIAEVESSMNPLATSPVGARGLFQFMPLTAARFGLEAGVLADDRTDPEKSARAAAAYLRVLHRRFRSWPLALAAYNAGEGRVGRALASEKVTTFEAVAHRLPVETRMYVPKVLATVAAREGIDPAALPAPMAVMAGGIEVVKDENGGLASAVAAVPAGADPL